MRKIDAFALTPPTLLPAGKGGKTNQDNLAQHLVDPAKSKSFGSHWNEPDVRGLLYANQWRVCAYCNRFLPGGDRGDVEHYRPKKKVTGDKSHGGYWWLAYDLENYVLSCRTCNSTRKGNRFPLQPPMRRSKFETDPNLTIEVAQLFHPKLDDVDEWFAVDLDHRFAKVVVRPNGLSAAQKQAAKASLKFFRINSDRYLIEERLHFLEKTIEAVESGNIAAASRLASRYSPQSLVARQVLLESNPGALPSVADEVGWLLERIVNEFDTLTGVLEEDPDDGRSEKELEETIWSMTTLYRSPPDGNQQRISDICDALGLLAEVQRRSAAML